MTAQELKKRRFFRCLHGHNGLEHPKCFDKGENTRERIGFLDIESSGLKADFGIVLTYCIKKENGEIIKRSITPEEIKQGIFDKNLMKQFVKDALLFDRLITYYGAKFDIPFLRTRCLFHNIDFPVFQELKHTDAYLIMKYKFKLHSNRLGVAAPFFGIRAKDHPLNPEVWLRCLSGNQKAIDFVLQHNQEDVLSLEELWHKTNRFVKINKTSI